MSGDQRPVAILCSGPSLRERWAAVDPGDYAATVAINMVGHVYRCDWLCFMDQIVVAPIRRRRIPGPRLGFVYHLAIDIGATPLARVDLYATLRARDVRPPEISWDAKSCFTFPHALAWVLERWPEQEIHVFGMDYTTGGSDFRGMPGDHSNTRWRKELAWLRMIWERRVLVFGDLSAERRAYLLTGPYAGGLPRLDCALQSGAAGAQVVS